MNLSKRLERLEARMHPVSRGLELFVNTLDALRSKDPARIAAMRDELAREPDDALGKGQWVNLSRGFLAMSNEP